MKREQGAIESDQVKRILVITYGHVADTLASWPALRELRQTYPSARISVLTVSYVREMFESCPYIDEVIVFRDFTRKGTKLAKAERFLRLVELGGQVFRRFDLAIVLHARSKFFTLAAFLTGARYRVGYLDGARSWLLTHRAEDYEGMLSFREENRRVMVALGLGEGSQTFDLAPLAKDRRWVEEFLASTSPTGFAPSTIVTLHPGSHWSCQQWYPRRWAMVADRLTERYGVTCVITGTADELELAQEIAGQMRATPIIAAGKTTIMQAAALFKRSKLLICVNSAASQLGTAIGTPTLNLIGAEDETWTAGRPEESMRLLRRCGERDSCGNWCPYGVWGKLSHCLRTECIGRSGLSLIKVSDVLAEAEVYLGQACVSETVV